MMHALRAVQQIPPSPFSILYELEEVPSMKARTLIYFNSCAYDLRDRNHVFDEEGSGLIKSTRDSD